MTTFSVIIPVYNASSYIEQSLISVFAQTYTDFEVIVVDDGSTDNTAEVVHRFSQHNPLRYIHQANAGPSAARNRGIEEAKGTFIAFLDADDLWKPQKLALHFDRLQVSPQLGLSFNWFEVFYDLPDAEFSDPKSVKPWFLPPNKSTLHWSEFLKRNWTGTSSTVIVRAKCLETLRFDARFRTGEDYYLWLEIAQAGWEIGFIPDVLTVYRKRPRSLTVDYLQIALDELYVAREMADCCDPAFQRAFNLAVTRRQVDVAWAYIKTGKAREAWASICQDQGYSAIPQFVAERLTRKWLHRSSHS